MLHFLEFVLHHVQAGYASFEIPREVGKKRRNLRVFEVLELGDDVVALLPRFHPIDEILKTLAAKADMIDALREHSGEKQRVVTDVFAHLALAVK